LMHVLPKGFVKVRHYGLLANGQRQSKLALCRSLLVLAAVLMAALGEAGVTPAERRCPQCGVGCLHCVEELPGPGGQPQRVRVSTRYDTS
jgi:hypothetical protein